MQSFALVLLLGWLSHSNIVHAADLLTCVERVFAPTDAYERIVLPNNDTYTDARLGENVLSQEFPALIAYALYPEEVAPLLRCARAANVQAVPRSGGHNFEGYSALNNSLVIDISHLTFVTVASDGQTAKVGAGIRLGALYTALDEYNATFPGGICPTVGMGGFIGSGGFNMQMRALGLAVDYVVAATVVLADGTIVTASKTSHPNLFWAIRGGGGGTYGIVLDFTLQLVRLPRSAMLWMSWEQQNVTFDVAKTFLEWGPRQVNEFTSQVNVYQNYSTVLGWFLGGSAQDLQAIVDASGLLTIGTPTVVISEGCDTDDSREFGYVNLACVPDGNVNTQILNVIPNPFEQWEEYPQFAYDEAPISSSVAAAPAWPRQQRISKSFFVQKENQLRDDTLQGVIDRIQSLDYASGIWGEWHSWNLTSSNETSAFAWRDQAYAHLEFTLQGSSNSTIQAAREAWIADLETFLRPQVGPASYVGYMDANIPCPLEAYFGNNVCRLTDIKRAYDPGNYFSNPLSVSPYAPTEFRCDW